MQASGGTSGSAVGPASPAPPLSYRLVLLGDIGVGKSSVALRYVRDQFDEHHNPTVGASYFTYSVNLSGKSVRLEIWDTAGQERYDSIAPIYYKGADAAIVCYDITAEHTYERAMRWVKRLQTEVEGMSIALVGNKLDLEASRTVSSETAAKYAEETGVMYREVSAKTAAGIVPLFTALMDGLLKRPPRNASTAAAGMTLLSGSSSLASEEPPRRTCCSSF